MRSRLPGREPALNGKSGYGVFAATMIGCKKKFVAVPASTETADAEKLVLTCVEAAKLHAGIEIASNNPKITR